ncbi:hypothetical protein BDN72DRAFT_900353 [Pluteus cervinus]|uniref:Uncharacterized protein n=1 Tax=Pluteus cervinus TaxID=181527 RepID=A0ACD3ALR4_9AGAR|nr:hypothetical protein BDN72DRAFT_900353 [Pluteus cervinus]
MNFHGQASANISNSPVFNTQYIYNSATYNSDPLKFLRDNSALTAPFDSAGRCDALLCHPATRKVIKEHFTYWVDYAAESVLKWLYGPMGVGKSAFAKWIAEYYERKHQLAASFFFFGGHQDTNHIGKLIPSIAYRIAVSVPVARPRIIEQINNDPTILTKSLATQWKKLIIEPLAYVQYPILIVIDGIDEIVSATEQSSLLRCILSASGRSGPFIKILLTSRPESQIREEFDIFGLGETSRIPLGASGEDAADLRTFLTLSLDQVHKRRQANRTMTQVPAPWPPPGKLDELVRMADRQFVYSTLLVSFIDDTDTNPVTQLDLVLQGRSSVLGNLDRLYLMMMERAREKTPKQHRQLLQNLLATAFQHHCGSESVSLHLLPPLAAFWSEDPALIEITLGRLASVLTYCSGTWDEINFHHLSFVEFMLNPSFPHPFVINQASFTPIAQRCLDLIRESSDLDPDQIYNRPACLDSLNNWVGYCSSSLPSPRSLLQLASLGLMPYPYVIHCVWCQNGLLRVRSMLYNHQGLLTWLDSWPFLSGWLEPLFPIELIENLAYELLCHQSALGKQPFLQQLITSEKSPRECRIFLNQRVREFRPEIDIPEGRTPFVRLSPDVRAWLNSVKHAARPTVG